MLVSMCFACLVEPVRTSGVPETGVHMRTVWARKTCTGRGDTDVKEVNVQLLQTMGFRRQPWHKFVIRLAPVPCV